MGRRGARVAVAGSSDGRSLPGREGPCGVWVPGLVRGLGVMGSVAAVLLVLLEGFFELVFEDDDAAGRFYGGALVADFSGAGGQT